MRLTEFIARGTAALESLYPTKEARSVVLILCEHLIGTKSYTHIVEPAYEIPGNKMEVLQAAMDRLVKGEPIQYVTGESEFCGLTFKVTPDVLIPRPETELLVREAIKIGTRIYRMRIPYGKSAEPVRILDLCTGSGCIAWKVALSVPTARVVAEDISEAALKVARSQDFAVPFREAGAVPPQFVRMDILDLEQAFDYGPFDLILSNPPYIMESEKSLLRPNVLEYEPASALFVPDDDPLKFYRAIAEWSKRLLAPDGKCLTEINEVLGAETELLFRKAGFSATDVIKDFYDRNRFIFYQK